MVNAKCEMRGNNMEMAIGNGTRVTGFERDYEVDFGIARYVVTPLLLKAMCLVPRCFTYVSYIYILFHIR